MFGTVLGVMTPLLLLGAGIWFGVRLRFFWFLHPRQCFAAIRGAAESGGTSPGAALSMALAGTLGVGNIAGVATAITAGGAGAVFWMLLGALLAMGVKYAEVYLAVRYRRPDGAGRYHGGAMYYIRDGLEARARTERGRRAARFAGGIFAFLCLINALLTGTLVQVRSAAECVPLPALAFGLLFAAAAIYVTRRGMARAARVTSVLIPALCALYILLSLLILLPRCSELPAVFARIWRGAWETRPALGGAAGLGVSRAIRYGITRGIFSNEAGCGTAPTAHAAANTKSPHHQGCLGIFEVFADTVVLCTLTALVILLYHNGEGADGAALTVAAFSRLCGESFGTWFGRAAQLLLRASVVLFAFATVLCQSCYGAQAIRYFTAPARARRMYALLLAAAVLAGALISPSLMWRLADSVVCVMTCANVIFLLLLSREVEGYKKRKP